MWFQRLNIQISQQTAMKSRFKTHHKKSAFKRKQPRTPQTPTHIVDADDLNTIKADLRRSEFTMPKMCASQ